MATKSTGRDETIINAKVYDEQSGKWLYEWERNSVNPSLGQQTYNPTVTTNGPRVDKVPYEYRNLGEQTYNPTVKTNGPRVDKVEWSDRNLTNTNNQPSYTAPSAPSVAVGNYTYNTFQPSQNVLDALNLTNSLLEKVNSGKTSYSDKVAGMIDQIANREKFSYDPNTDTLFQNSLASAIRNGQSAMQDTLGNAAGLTGGYGSTYATSAANQAYNNYLQGAYDNLPEFYNTAFNTYNQETQDLYNKLGMYNDADATEYNRIYTAYAANNDRYNNLWNQEHTVFRDTESDRMWAEQMAQTDRWNQAHLDQSYAQMAQSQAQYDASMDYQKQNDMQAKFAYIDSVAGDDEALKERMLRAYGLI